MQSSKTHLQLFSPQHLFRRRNEMIKFQLEKRVLDEHGCGILCSLVILQIGFRNPKQAVHCKLLLCWRQVFLLQVIPYRLAWLQICPWWDYFKTTSVKKKWLTNHNTRTCMVLHLCKHSLCLIKHVYVTRVIALKLFSTPACLIYCSVYREPPWVNISWLWWLS